MATVQAAMDSAGILWKKANISRAVRDKLRRYQKRITSMDSQITPWQILGEDGIRQLTNTCYDGMDTLPDVASLQGVEDSSSGFNTRVSLKLE